jgi:hypothetical protein
MKWHTTRISILFCFLLTWPIYQSIAVDYYLAAYDEIAEGAPHDVSVKRINLENASIVGSAALRHGGS